jgi:endonuclease-3
MSKRPFVIEKAMPRLRAATALYPKAALFELAAEGHTSVFEILTACILSIRTRDEDIARRAVKEHDGVLPCTRDVLLSFHGVGPKCANLTLGIACGLPFIGVDIHVHRVTNRWGYVRTATPEKTMAALQEKLPRPYWIEINALLVPFGKHICTGVRPKCSLCPLLTMCRQVGVTAHR